MKGGAKRRTISSGTRSPQSQPVQNEISDQQNDQVQYSKQRREQEEEHQSMNDGDDAGNEVDEEEQEDEDYEEDEELSGDVDVHGGEGADGVGSKDDYERPKLAEGFYEIEAVRRRRIRKGETQYLIKWRGWPESSNTWEPVENLTACCDFIDAFEERRSKSTRKRKRKQSTGPTPQSKKKQRQPPHQRSPDATYDVPAVKITIIEEPSPIPSVNNSNFSTGTENNNLGATSNDITSPQIQETNNRLDIPLPELNLSSSTNQANMSEFAIHIQEDRVDEGGGNGTRKVDENEKEKEVVRVSPRIGARRRKSLAVKRFKQEPKLDAKDDVVVKEDEVKNIGVKGEGLGCNDIVGISGNLSAIIRILKPVNYSTSVIKGVDDVSVSFLVSRADGEEVVVDNKYLKEHNPLLLINFYEQHLRYNSPSE